MYGTAIFTATVDCIRGTYTWDSYNTAEGFNGLVWGGIRKGVLKERHKWYWVKHFISHDSYRIFLLQPSDLKIHLVARPGNTQPFILVLFRLLFVGEPLI